jgi:hypothetical protein
MANSSSEVARTGNSSRQGGQVGLQNVSRTGRPAKSARETVSPSRLGREKSGAGVPISSGSGMIKKGKRQQQGTINKVESRGIQRPLMACLLPTKNICGGHCDCPGYHLASEWDLAKHR